MGDRVNQVTLGSTFRATWASSGSSPSPIVYNVRTGSETLANSYAGVSSGNGFFYADVQVNSPGLWKGEWYATVSANTYRNTEWLLANAGDADQPGRYITWDDVVNRFVPFADVADAVKAASHYLSYAEAYIDGRLGAKFTTPFSNNNSTVRDLTIDVVYARSIRGSLNAEYKAIWAEVNSRLASLLMGESVMVADSGSVLQTTNVSAWSNTSDYHPVFSPVLDETLLSADSSYLAAERSDRGLNG